MTLEDAAGLLEDAEVVPCLEAGLGEAKELLAACLEAGIPAILDQADCCSTGGCGTKLALLVRPNDVPGVRDLLDRRWRQMVAREGTLALADDAASAEGALSCPACGHTGSLTDGACAECGLQLG